MPRDTTTQPREIVEHTIQRLLDAAERLMWELDDSDGDPDVEPSLGALAALDQRQWPSGVTDDREELCEDEGGACEDEGAASGDDEPWLGACPPYGAAFDGEMLASAEWAHG